MGNEGITGEMSFEMIKWKRLAMSAPVNQAGPGCVASCRAAAICTVFLVWPVAWLLSCSRHPEWAEKFHAEQPAVNHLGSLPWSERTSTAIATLGNRGDTGKTRNHHIWEIPLLVKEKEVIHVRWHAPYCHNVYLFIFTSSLITLNISRIP